MGRGAFEAQSSGVRARSLVHHVLRPLWMRVGALQHVILQVAGLSLQLSWPVAHTAHLVADLRRLSLVLCQLLGHLLALSFDICAPGRCLECHSKSWGWIRRFIQLLVELLHTQPGGRNAWMPSPL